MELLYGKDEKCVFWVIYGFTIFSIFFFVFVRVFFVSFLTKYVINEYYQNWTKKQKVDFPSRICSTVHSLVFIPSFVIFFSHKEFYEQMDFFVGSKIITLVVCFSLGYFIYDMVAIVVEIFYLKSRNDYLMLFHHFVGVISAYSLFCLCNTYHVASMFYWFTEITTPFVNMIFLLKYFNLRKSVIYYINGVILMIMWIVVRFLMIVFVLSYYIIINFKGILLLGPWQPYMIVFCHLACCVMNTVWGYRIIKGFISALQGKKLEIDKKE